MAIYKSINSPARSESALKGVLRYVLDKRKTEGRLCYVTGYFDEVTITPRTVFSSFQDVKIEWDKATEGRQYAHNVISFHKEEKISPEEVLGFAKCFANHVYPDHQTLITVHTDKEHLHAHLIVNTVNYMDGRKLHKSKRDLERDKKYCNALCRKYGFHVEEKGRRFDGGKMSRSEPTVWDKNLYYMLKENAQNSYIRDCALASLKAMKESKNKADYIHCMANRGWNVSWSDTRKHITYIDHRGHRVRHSKLENTFYDFPGKEELEKQFDKRQIRKHTITR